MVLPCFKVFWFSKDNPTGHSERTKKKRQTLKDGQEWTLPAQLGHLKTGQGVKRLLPLLSVVSRQPFKVMI